MKILLIPSAVLVPHDMRQQFGDLPTALFPLGDMTMIEHIYNKYKCKVDKIYIVVCQKKLLIHDYIELQHLPIELIELDKLSDLGYTIAYGIAYILKHNSDVNYLYVNFADSLLEDELPEGNSDVVYYSGNANAENWTYFSDHDGRFVRIIDKDCFEKASDRYDKRLKDIFVGVFGIRDVDKFLLFLQQASKGTTDSFYQAVFRYSQDCPFLMLETEKWFDVGHNENYYKAKTSVAARVFNTIEIDEKRGILKKSSENKEKLVDEIRWYLRLPNKLQYLLPRIYDYSLDLNMPYVSMEYYGYHTLHESLMYAEFPLVKWQDIFNKVLFAIGDMENYQLSGTSEDFELALQEIYLNKTFIRLDKIRDNELFSDFFSKPIKINGAVYKSLNEYIAILPKLVDDLVIKTFSGHFNIIHGDLCFANILMEDTYNFIRLIDPRGKFGAYDIYGDSRYELAKLMHTLEGKYDFIIEDRFMIQVDGNTINYHVNKNIDHVIEVFIDVFKDKLQDMQAIRLIEATLFLSMIPLHKDYPRRQYAMLATGVMLLEQVIQENINGV